MARLEYKYGIPVEYLDDMRKNVMPFLTYDVHTRDKEKKEYTVHSLYLDSQQMLSYNEKLSGVKSRHKFRIRGYDKPIENSLVFLEIKRKDCDYISKDRALLKYNDLENFLKTSDYSLIQVGDKDILHLKTCAQNFLYYYHYHVLQPSVYINYEREAFECKFGSGLRITFDKNIRAKRANNFTELFSEDNFQPAYKNLFVLEVKFHRTVPSWLSNVLKKFNIIRESVPKYVLSVDRSYSNKKHLIMN